MGKKRKKKSRKSEEETWWKKIVAGVSVELNLRQNRTKKSPQEELKKALVRKQKRIWLGGDSWGRSSAGPVVAKLVQGRDP